MIVFFICAGLIGLLAAILTINVGRLRNKKKIFLGDGGDPAGRVYTVTIGASDGCNNVTPFDARVTVPHDQAPSARCRRPNAGKSIPATR